MSTPSIADRGYEAAGYVPMLSLLGRMLMAAIFIISGAVKVANPEATAGYIASAGLPAPEAALIVAVLIEIVGGVALIVGYRTRTVASVLALFCVVTALSFHTAFNDQNQFIHFLKNLTMAGGFLQIAAFGPGTISVDARHRQGAVGTPGR
ncbi:DoxX family protein [Lysobacter sp. FW306-1B-D06B]|uniref:DoxX family protein n=1 Tax=Lysobacter sp. FW306-1B-D06B TaxID=3140250 RepID=UPI003140B73A